MPAILTQEQAITTLVSKSPYYPEEQHGKGTT